MKLVFAVEGTAGDLQPIISFCHLLKERGHSAIVCSSASNFATGDDGKLTISRRPEPQLPEGFEFVRLPMCTMDVASEVQADVVSGDKDRQTAGFAYFWGTMCHSGADAVLSAVATAKPDAFISNNSAFVYLVHEVANVPAGWLLLQPQMVTAAFPTQLADAWLSPAAERTVSCVRSGELSQEFAQSYIHTNVVKSARIEPLMADLRTRLVPSAGPLPEGAALWGWLDGPASSSTAEKFAINAFSPAFFSEGFSYGPSAPIVGHWASPEADCAEFTPPEGLVQFLEACSYRPVYLGFGSMSTPIGPAKTTQLCLSALRAFAHDQQFVVGAGWAQLSTDALDDTDTETAALREWAAAHVFFLHGHIPHAWLFPRCRMAVHHGGAGTTHAAAAAGLTQVIIPCLLDQPFWGAALEDCGAGVRLQKFMYDPTLTADEITAGMLRADEEAARQRAAELQAAVQAHGDGCERTLEFLQRIVTTDAPPQTGKLSAVSGNVVAQNATTVTA